MTIVEEGQTIPEHENRSAITGGKPSNALDLIPTVVLENLNKSEGTGDAWQHGPEVEDELG